MLMVSAINFENKLLKMNHVEQMLDGGPGASLCDAGSCKNCKSDCIVSDCMGQKFIAKTC